MDRIHELHRLRNTLRDIWPKTLDDARRISDLVVTGWDMNTMRPFSIRLSDSKYTFYESEVINTLNT